MRPQDAEDRLEGLREAVLNAPVFKDVYGHYRGENLPDPQFFRNALTEKFQIPADKIAEFQEVFAASLKAAELLKEHDGTYRVLTCHMSATTTTAETPTLEKSLKKP